MLCITVMFTQLIILALKDNQCCQCKTSIKAQILCNILSILSTPKVAFPQMLCKLIQLLLSLK